MRRRHSSLIWRFFLIVVCFASVGQIAVAAPPGKLDVLVAFKKWPGQSEWNLVRNQGGQVKRSFNLVPAVAARIPQAALNILQKNPNVLLIEPDMEIHALDYQEELGNSWGVDHIDSESAYLNDPMIIGNQVKVAVIDSGIDLDHPELVFNYAGGYDFVDNDSTPNDENGHGTHCAGIIAAIDDGAGVVGVAPGVELYALRVLDENGSGSFSDVISALEWCVANGIQVTSNSYGSGGNPGSIVEQAFINAQEAGILNIAAAGNSGNSDGTGDNVGFPARYASVMAVGATDGNDERTSFSSTGPDVEVVAPGLNIISTYPDDQYAYLSGTSMACPHVAGMAALMFEAGSGQALDGAGIRQILIDSCIDLGDSGRDSHYGYGLVNVTAGLLLLGSSSSDPPQETEPEAEVMGVSAIKFRLLRRRRDMVITLVVTTESGAPVPDASVTVFLKARGDSYGTFTRTTDGNGEATLRINNAVKGYWRVSVTDVTADGYVWDGVDPYRLWYKRY